MSRIFRCFQIVVIALVGLVAPAALAQTEPGFRRFEETISPDGAYVLAWGWSKAGDLAALKEWPKEQDNDQEAVENYLVDAVEGRVLAIIPGFTYFRGTPGRENHNGLSVGWSADSRDALAIYDGRWTNEAVVWIRPATRTLINVRDQLDDAYRGLLKAREKQRDPGGISFQYPAVLPGGVLVADAWAQHPKEDPVFHYRVRFRVKIDGDKARCEVVSGRKIPDEIQEPTDEAALNKVYGQLRASLNDAGRAALKKEELAWLKQRAAMESEVHRDDFTRMRVSALRARMGK